MRQNRFYWTCPNREFGPGANPSAGCKYWSWGDKASASQMAGIARNVSAANACVSILLAAVRLVCQELRPLRCALQEAEATRPGHPLLALVTGVTVAATERAMSMDEIARRREPQSMH